jgi:hypothetical protein
MEHRLGQDFSRVRIHTGPAAEKSAREVDADAYTVGHHVVFGVPGLTPEAPDGHGLLAHELAHVVQQSARPTGTPVLQRKPRRSTGVHDVTISVRFVDDPGELGHRLVAAIARETGIPEAALFQPMFSDRLAENTYFTLATRRDGKVKPGERVRLDVHVSYDSQGSSPATMTIRPTQSAASAPPRSTPAATTRPDPVAGAALRQATDLLMQAYRRTIGSARLTLRYDGKVVQLTGWEVGRTVRQHEPGKLPLTESYVTARVTEWIQLLMLSGKPQEMVREVSLDNMLTLQRSAVRGLNEPAAPRPAPVRRMVSEGDEDVMAIVREIRGKEKLIADVGAKALHEADPFTLRNLPYLAAGILIPMAAGYAVMNFDTLTGMIQITRYSEFGEITEVELLSSSEMSATSADLGAVPRLPAARPEPIEIPSSIAPTEAPTLRTPGAAARSEPITAPRTPQAVEKDITTAIKSNVAGENPALNHVWEDRSLGTILEDLQVRRAELAKSGQGDLLPPLNDSFLDLGATDFVRQYGSPRLRAEFDALSRARPGSELYEEFSKFLSQGRMRTRRPDSVEIRLGVRDVSVRGEAEVTDVSMKVNAARVRVHEFKTQFNTEAVRTMLGPDGPAVRGYEVNTKLPRNIEYK